MKSHDEIAKKTSTRIFDIIINLNGETGLPHSIFEKADFGPQQESWLIVKILFNS